MFAEFLPHILQEEGGYVNDPQDSGGATNRGITQNTYDSFRESLGQTKRGVQYLTKAETSKIYEEYWRNSRADKLPDGMNLIHFDFAVNAGFRRAAITLQRSLGITEDGIIGPVTLKTVEEKNGEALIKDYAELRREFYRGLSERRPKDRKFLRGWILRTDRMEERAINAYRQSTSNS